MLAHWEKLLAALAREGIAAWLALRDPRTPLSAKLICLASVAYIVLPFDLIPDLIPIIGWLDDLAALPLAVAVAGRLIPNDVIGDLRERADRILLRHGRTALYVAAAVFVLWMALAALGLWFWLRPHGGDVSARPDVPSPSTAVR